MTIEKATFDARGVSISWPVTGGAHLLPATSIRLQMSQAGGATQS
jgi:hypothetical protein